MYFLCCIKIFNIFNSQSDNLQTKKTKFKAVIRKYLNTRSFYSVDAFVCVKINISTILYYVYSILHSKIVYICVFMTCSTSCCLCHNFWIRRMYKNVRKLNHEGPRGPQTERLKAVLFLHTYIKLLTWNAALEHELMVFENKNLTRNYHDTSFINIHLKTNVNLRYLHILCSYRTEDTVSFHQKTRGINLYREINVLHCRYHKDTKY